VPTTVDIEIHICVLQLLCGQITGCLRWFASHTACG